MQGHVSILFYPFFCIPCHHTRLLKLKLKSLDAEWEFRKVATQSFYLGVVITGGNKYQGSLVPVPT